MTFEEYDDIKPVRPYLWYGEDHDAHVKDWMKADRRPVVAGATGSYLAWLSDASGYMSSQVQFASLQNMSLSGQMMAAELQRQHQTTNFLGGVMHGAIQGLGIR